MILNPLCLYSFSPWFVARSCRSLPALPKSYYQNHGSGKSDHFWIQGSVVRFFMGERVAFPNVYLPKEKTTGSVTKVSSTICKIPRFWCDHASAIVPIQPRVNWVDQQWLAWSSSFNFYITGGCFLLLPFKQNTRAILQPPKSRRSPVKTHKNPRHLVFWSNIGKRCTSKSPP